MKNSCKILVIILIMLLQNAFAQTVTIQVNALQGRKAIFPYIYGKNNTVSDDPGSHTSAAEWRHLKVALCNILGEVVYSGSYSDKSSSRIEISINDLPNGVYIVKISSANKKNFTSRIVKM